MESDLQENLRMAILRGDSDKVERLLAAGADPNEPAGNIDRAFYKGDTAVLKALLQAGASWIPNGAAAPLHWLTRMDPTLDEALVIVRAFTAAGESPLDRDIHGRTPLGLARERGHREIEMAFIEAGNQSANPLNIEGYLAERHAKLLREFLETARQAQVNDRLPLLWDVDEKGSGLIRQAVNRGWSHLGVDFSGVDEPNWADLSSSFDRPDQMIQLSPHALCSDLDGRWAPTTEELVSMVTCLFYASVVNRVLGGSVEWTEYTTPGLPTIDVALRYVNNGLKVDRSTGFELDTFAGLGLISRSPLRC